MSERLGTLEELPAEYRAALGQQSVAPAWPSLRALIPYDIPDRRSQPHVWRYNDLRPLLLRAADLAPMERAERRVLMLGNPGLAPEPFATASIFLGLQIILPGEFAPNHRHSPSAVRLVIEGTGAHTTVEGERCSMERGDVILTPAGHWHQHEHTGSGPMVWLDALDAAVVCRIEASYCKPGTPQGPNNRPDASQWRFRRAGLVPYERAVRDAAEYPLLRYPWIDVRAALEALATHAASDEAVHLAYVNPETGEPCMPMLGFSARWLRPGEDLGLRRRSSSAGLLVIEGEGESEIDGQTLRWSENDVVAIPAHAEVRHRNGSSKRPACLIQVDDVPLQRKLGIYEEFNGAT